MNSKKGRLLYWIICATLVIVVALIPTTADEVSAAGCSGSSCNGYNPNSMGCDGDAYTSFSKSITNGTVQNRVSSTCEAAWARTINQSGSYKYAAATIRYGGTNYVYSYSVRSSSAIANGAVVYTVMVAPESTIPTRSCGKVNTSGPISIPLSLSETYCTVYFE